jgi:uncharacterized protein YcbK (DUF882 family)
MVENSLLDTNGTHRLRFDRRNFLKMGAFALLGSFCPVPAFAYSNARLFPNKRLALYNVHTDEKIDVSYCVKGKYSSKGLKAINYILRDFRTDDIYRIDTELLDLLYGLSRKLNPREPFHIISGYRSPATNAMLREKSIGVARNSYHLKGKAIDVRLPDLSLYRLKKTAMKLEAGGVGYYPESDFVHLDIGPIRHW